MDLGFSIALFVALAVAAAIYGVRRVAVGRARHPRVDKEGESAIVGRGTMEGFYWWLQPIARACARVGLSANAVTYVSLALGLAAGLALATAHFGLGAALACASAACDAMDGLVARATGTSGDAGEVLDAAVDRWVDFALVGGLAIAFRADVVLLVLALGAILASFMVSYSTAKAEALHVEPPRGSMRRVERSVLVIGACALAPIAERVREGGAALAVACALAVVAVLGNASAAARLRAVRRAVMRRDAAAREARDAARAPAGE